MNDFTREWEHIDLFAVRDATQQNVVDLLQPDGVLTEFAEAQLQVFDDLLASLRPKLVVVINAKASAVVKKRFESRCIFSDEFGHHLIDFGSGTLPAFFSGMLTGQRALDVHSRERLVWHVRRTLARLASKGSSETQHGS